LPVAAVLVGVGVADAGAWLELADAAALPGPEEK